MGNTLPKNLPGEPLAGPNVKQGEFSSSGQLNTTALKADTMGPNNKAETNSINNSKKKKTNKGPKTNILTNFYRGSKAHAKNFNKQY